MRVTTRDPANMSLEAGADAFMDISYPAIPSVAKMPCITSRVGHRRGCRPDKDACRCECRRTIYYWSLYRPIRGFAVALRGCGGDFCAWATTTASAQPQPEEQLESTAPAAED